MNTDSPFAGQSVAVTGKLDHYTRTGIKTRLLELGAKPVSAVSRRTGYLIVGKRPGSKLDKARSLGISVLSEQEFEDMAGQQPMRIEIYWQDLSRAKQDEILQVFGENGNWDVFPIATIDAPTEDHTNL